MTTTKLFDTVVLINYYNIKYLSVFIDHIS
jgi:hypothetical protein